MLLATLIKTHSVIETHDLMLIETSALGHWCISNYCPEIDMKSYGELTNPSLNPLNGCSSIIFSFWSSFLTFSVDFYFHVTVRSRFANFLLGRQSSLICLSHVYVKCFENTGKIGRPFYATNQQHFTAWLWLRLLYADGASYVFQKGVDMNEKLAMQCTICYFTS